MMLALLASTSALPAGKAAGKGPGAPGATKNPAASAVSQSNPPQSPALTDSPGARRYRFIVHADFVAMGAVILGATARV